MFPVIHAIPAMPALPAFPVGAATPRTDADRRRPIHKTTPSDLINLNIKTARCGEVRGQYYNPVIDIALKPLTICCSNCTNIITQIDTYISLVGRTPIKSQLAFRTKMLGNIERYFRIYCNSAKANIAPISILIYVSPQSANSVLCDILHTVGFEQLNIWFKYINKYTIDVCDVEFVRDFMYKYTTYVNDTENIIDEATHSRAICYELAHELRKRRSDAYTFLWIVGHAKFDCIATDILATDVLVAEREDINRGVWLSLYQDALPLDVKKLIVEFICSASIAGDAGDVGAGDANKPFS